VRFVLIGYLDVQHSPWQSGDARLTVHGRYEPSELPALLDHYRVVLVLYPSAGPETFSFTLSEARAAGRPALVPPIGALAERMNGSGAGWVMNDSQWRDEAAMLDRILAIVDRTHANELEAASRQARAVPHTTLGEMTDATFAIYERALSGARSRTPSRVFDRARVRDALGYTPWQPPPPEVAPEPEASIPVTAVQVGERGMGLRIAAAALSIRHTAVGRALYRVTPRPVLNALKARLRP